MEPSTTRAALLEQGALLFARCGVDGVTTRQLHEAVGARNESALHYHFGNRTGLMKAILSVHFTRIEVRRAPLVDAIESAGRVDDLHALVHALAAPMSDDLADPVGRAHLRLVAALNQPEMAYEDPFRSAERFAEVDARSGAAVVRRLTRALAGLGADVRAERLVALREQLIGLFGQRARLTDDHPSLAAPERIELFLNNLIDMLVAGLTVEPGAATAAAARRLHRTRRRAVTPHRRSTGGTP